MKTCKKLVIIIKSTGEDSDKKNNSNKEDFENSIFKIIKLFFNKEPSFNNLNNKELKLFFLLFLRRL